MNTNLLIVSSSIDLRQPTQTSNVGRSSATVEETDTPTNKIPELLFSPRSFLSIPLAISACSGLTNGIRPIRPILAPIHRDKG